MRVTWQQTLNQALLAGPAVLLLLVVLIIPLLHLLLLGVAGFTFSPYQEALGDPLYLAVLWLTLRIALATAAIALVLAYPLAFFLATTTRLWATLGFVFVLLPFWTSLLVRTYSWMALLGRNGVINRALLDLGLIDQPLPLLYNFGGVLVGMVHVLLPYMVFPIYTAMVRVDRTLVDAAGGLGAGPWSIFRYIYLPLTLKGIFAGTALVFTLSLGAFVTPALLGGGRVIMIANLIEQQVSHFINWPFASALSVILLVTAMGIYVALSRVTGGTRNLAL